MSEMVERVKQALLECKPGESMARAAIAAMREPTPDMLWAGDLQLDCGREKECWQAMIDAALK